MATSETVGATATSRPPTKNAPRPRRSEWGGGGVRAWWFDMTQARHVTSNVGPFRAGRGGAGGWGEGAAAHHFFGGDKKKGGGGGRAPPGGWACRPPVSFQHPMPPFPRGLWRPPPPPPRGAGDVTPVPTATTARYRT